jgi:hypothetical protein
MRIIGCNLHVREQTLAILDTTTGEVEEKILARGRPGARVLLRVFSSVRKRIANEPLSQLSYSPTSSHRNFSKGLQPCQPPRLHDTREENALRLFERCSGTLCDHSFRVLIQRARLGNGVHRRLHLRVGF